MLGADTGVVEAGADAVRLADLAVLVLHEIAVAAVEDSGGAGVQGRGVLAGIDATASGLDSD